MKKALLLLILSVSVVGFSGCTLPVSTSKLSQDKQEENEMLQEEVLAQKEATQDVHTFTAETDGQTALELFEENLKLDYKKYDFGVFIEGVNGVAGDDKNYWAFYLNDEYAEKGAGQTILKKGDIVSMRYEEVKEF